MTVCVARLGVNDEMKSREGVAVRGESEVGDGVIEGVCVGAIGVDVGEKVKVGLGVRDGVREGVRVGIIGVDVGGRVAVAVTRLTGIWRIWPT